MTLLFHLVLACSVLALVVTIVHALWPHHGARLDRAARRRIARDRQERAGRLGLVRRPDPYDVNRWRKQP